MKSVFIHIGLSKTGTTFLQNNFFEKHPEIFNLGKPNFSKDENVMLIRSSIIKNNDINFLTSDKMKYLKKKIKTLCQKKTVIFSEENFSNNPKNLQRNAQRIKKVFGEVKIIITIRNQINFLESLFFSDLYKSYSNNLTGENNEILTDFNVWLKKNWNYLEKRISFKMIIDYYSKTFTNKNVSILVYEEMSSDIKKFSWKISQILGINKSKSENLFRNSKTNKIRKRLSSKKFVLIKMLRFIPVEYLKSLLPSFITQILSEFFNKGKGAKIHLTNESKKLLMDKIKKENNYLVKKFNLNLKKFNYPL